MQQHETNKACPSKQPIRAVHGQHWYYALRRMGLDINGFNGLLEDLSSVTEEISSLTSCTLLCTQGVKGHLCLPHSLPCLEMRSAQGSLPARCRCHLALCPFLTWPQSSICGTRCELMCSGLVGEQEQQGQFWEHIPLPGLSTGGWEVSAPFSGSWVQNRLGLC